MLTAITRGVSTSLRDCQLTFLQLTPIDLEKAIYQHEAYKQALAQLGVQLVSLPLEPDLPDAVFVEDTAVVVDEVAIVAPMGTAQRRPETKSLVPVLSCYRPLKFLPPQTSLEGGDVIRIGRTLFVGVSTRTNREGVTALQSIFQPYHYEVRPVEVTGCLHLTTGCSYIGRNTILANTSWVDVSAFEGFDIIDVNSVDEPWAPNTIVIGDVIMISSSFPATKAMLKKRGFNVLSVDISEFEKAEAGLSCMSKIFNDAPAQSQLSGL